MAKFETPYIASSKLIEEVGELMQAVAKVNDLVINNGSKKDLKYYSKMVPEEIADVLAAIDYFIEVNGLDYSEISERRKTKMKSHTRKNRI